MQVMEEVYAVKVRARPDAARLYPSERRYSASTVGGLGAVHLALAVTCILLTALDMGQPLDAAPKWTGRYGGGAWLGLAAALAGLTGIVAWRRWYIDNNIRWFFICSCISGTAALLCLSVTAAALATTHEDWSTRRVNALNTLRNLNVQLADGVPPEPSSLSLHFATEDLRKTSNHLRHEDDVQKRETERPSPDSVTQMTVKTFENDDVHVKESDFNIPHVTSSRPTQQETHILQIPQHPRVQKVPLTEDSSGISNVPMLPGENQQVEYPEEDLKEMDDFIPSQNVHDLEHLTESSSHVDDVLVAEAQSTNHHHHVSSRQTISDDQFVDETDDTRIQGENHSVMVEDRGSDPGQTLNEDGGNDLDTGKKDDGEKIPKVIIEHHWFPEGREMRFVIAINILVASLLEMAWSLLSAKIAWKGMKNGYPDDSPRSDTRAAEEQAQSTEAKRAKKNGKLRKPDIISNHDKSDTRRKKKEDEGRDPRLPLEESTMEYQERVRRFLASNNVNVEAVGE